MAASRSTGSSLPPIASPADVARRSSTTGSAATSAGGLGGDPSEQAPIAIDEIAPRPDAPDEDGRALLEADHQALGQADVDVRGSHRRQLDAVPPRAVRCGARRGCRRGRPRAPARRRPDRCTRRLRGAGRGTRRSRHWRHRRSRPPATQHRQQGAGADRRQPGRGPSDGAGAADRRFRVRLARRRPGRRAADRRSLGHRGRSDGRRCVAGRAACRSRASSTMRRHTSVKL